MPKSKKRKGVKPKVTKKKEVTAVKSHIDRKEFNYELNGTKLGFQLRTDISQELVDFEVLLKIALKEVREVIDEKFSSKK